MEDEPWFFDRVYDGRYLETGVLNNSKRRMSQSMAAGKIKRPALINHHNDIDEDKAEIIT